MMQKTLPCGRFGHQLMRGWSFFFFFFLLLFFTPPDRVASTGFGCQAADGDASKTVTDPTVCVYTIDASVTTSSGVGRTLIIIIRFFVYYFFEFLYFFYFRKRHNPSTSFHPVNRHFDDNNKKKKNLNPDKLTVDVRINVSSGPFYFRPQTTASTTRLYIIIYIYILILYDFYFRRLLMAFINFSFRFPFIRLKHFDRTIFVRMEKRFFK